MAWRIREECFPTLREGEREFRERSARNRIHRRDRLPYGSSRRRSRRRSPRPEPVLEGNGWHTRQEQEIARLPNRSDEQAMAPRLAVHPQIPEDKLHPTPRHQE